MPSELSAWLAISLVAGVTFASRVLGSVVMSRVAASPFVARFLDGLSVSVIAALVASMLAQGGYREAAAVAVAALVMLGLKSAAWGMIAGMAVAAGWTYVTAMS